ncbi:MAG: putative glycosyl hydrolase [Polyangiaceae bacterium]|jgi:hypothetical protein|nr:putative glycosyl hydrolase [Polyangiaceae bacterium]
MKLRSFVLAFAALGCDAGPHPLGREAAGSEAAPEPEPWFGGPSYHGDWPRGFPADSRYFPIGVWMQNPMNAARFAAVGVNHFVGLWEGPTAEQLATARDANMPVVCEQEGVWASSVDDRNIHGWLQADGPDNAQELPDGSYGPCIAPTETKARYADMVAEDASRPVVLLLGQGVATPDWVGRGECTGRTEDYPEYAASADILVNYTYPVANQNPLELVATGIQNLNRYASWKKPVFADIEASNIRGLRRPTPHELRAEVWMSLIHGAAGLSYFCHRMEPLNETDCLDDAETAAALTRINREVLELAPALNTQSYVLAPQSRNADVPVRAVLKQVGGERYVFAAGMADGATTGTFALRGVNGTTRVEVIGEGRDATAREGAFEDEFAPYDVHLYRLAAP